VPSSCAMVVDAHPDQPILELSPSEHKVTG
jgi:hypothetical protein